MTAREVERRYVAAPVEWRAAADGKGGPGVLFGYAAKYNTLSQNLGGFVETVAPGAFDKSLADEVRAMCRYNHKDSALLGTTDAGTLRVSSDDIGLPYDVDLPDTTAGNDVAVLAARGDVRFSSFAFICIEDDWGLTEAGFPLRTLLQVQLVDVAPVNNPAYLDTSVAKRSLGSKIELPITGDINVEEVRMLLGGGSPEIPQSEADDEQRETHSSASVLSMQMELDRIK